MKVGTGQAKFTDLIAVKIFACLLMSFSAVFAITFFFLANNFDVMFPTCFSEFAKTSLEVPAD